VRENLKIKVLWRILTEVIVLPSLMKGPGGFNFFFFGHVRASGADTLSV
jgi:hypothetical protein